MRLPTVNKFAAEIPKLESYELPAGYAQMAYNCDISRGALRAMRGPDREGSSALASIKSVHLYGTTWCFSANVRHYARSPIAGDAYSRVYFTGENEPRFFASDLTTAPAVFDPTTDYLKLGVTQPATGPTVGSTGGGATYKAYAYSYVNSYGEEGPPSVVDSISDYDSGRVTLATIAAAPATRGIDTVRVYRTNASGEGTAEFQFVLDATWFSATVGYAVGDFVVYSGAIYECTTIHAAAAWNAGNFTAGEAVADADLLSVFPKTNYDPPPSGLTNLVMLANGAMAGFVGNTLRFSEPFLPHAWPPEYEIGVDYTIVGLANEKNVITVAGAGVPYTVYGSHPLSMQRARGAEVLPLLGIRGICSGNSGVFFVTKFGIIFTDGNGFINILEKLIDPATWEAKGPANMLIFWYEKKLFVSHTVDKTTFYIDFAGEHLSIVNLTTHIHAGFIGGDGHFYVVLDDPASVSEADPPGTMPLAVFQWEGSELDYLQYTWRSGEFILPAPSNMGAVHIVLDASWYDTFEAQLDLATENAAIFAAGLTGAIGVDGPIGGGHPIGGDEMITVQGLSVSDTVTFKFYAGGVLRKTKQLTAADNKFRLPGKYLAGRVYYEFTGYLPVLAPVKIATSMDEL